MEILEGGVYLFGNVEECGLPQREMWGSQQQWGWSAEGIFPRGGIQSSWILKNVHNIPFAINTGMFTRCGTRSSWIFEKCTIFYSEKNTRSFHRGGINHPEYFKTNTNYSAAKFYLLKTIFTSATLMSPELSMNTFHSWISYSRRSFLPAVNLSLINLIIKQNVTQNLYNWLRYSLASTQWTLL